MPEKWLFQNYFKTFLVIQHTRDRVSKQPPKQTCEKSMTNEITENSINTHFLFQEVVNVIWD